MRSSRLETLDRRRAPELAFVVDVTSFTPSGFVGRTSYLGKAVDVAFDAEGKGVTLGTAMAARLGVRKGDMVVLTVEGDGQTTARLKVASLGRRVGISDPSVYHDVGSAGGAVVRVRKA
jgi:hypothetical protein